MNKTSESKLNRMVAILDYLKTQIRVPMVAGPQTGYFLVEDEAAREREEEYRCALRNEYNRLLAEIASETGVWLTERL